MFRADVIPRKSQYDVLCCFIRGVSSCYWVCARRIIRHHLSVLKPKSLRRQLVLCREVTHLTSTTTFVDCSSHLVESSHALRLGQHGFSSRYWLGNGPSQSKIRSIYLLNFLRLERPLCFETWMALYFAFSLLWMSSDFIICSVREPPVSASSRPRLLSGPPPTKVPMCEYFGIGAFKEPPLYRCLGSRIPRSFSIRK